MKLEQSEKLLIQELFKESISKKKVVAKTFSKVKNLTGDASTRRYYRVYSQSKSFVVCLCDPITTSYKEYPFFEVHQFFHQHKIRVPKIYDYNLKKGYILEEDLGDFTLLKYLGELEKLEDELSAYKECIHILISLQQSLLKTKKSPAKYLFLKNSFDYNKYMFEVEFTINHFIKKYLSSKLSSKDEKIIMDSFSKISKKLASKKFVLTHRDFHSRNIMVKGKDYALIDFQDARMGIPQYDLVSLLEDCYYNINEQNLEYLKKYYWENFASKLADQKNYDEYLHYYDLMTIQRVFKAIGSFCYIYNTRKDMRYLKYIGFGFEKLKNKLQDNEEYYKLKKLISALYYEH